MSIAHGRTIGRTVRAMSPIRRDALVAISSFVVLISLIAVDASPPVRMPFMLLVVLWMPGTAIVNLASLSRSAARLAMVVGLSIAVSTIIAQFLVLNDALRVWNAVALLGTTCAPIFALQLLLLRIDPTPNVESVGRHDYELAS